MRLEKDEHAFLRLHRRPHIGSDNVSLKGKRSRHEHSFAYSGRIAVNRRLSHHDALLSWLPLFKLRGNSMQWQMYEEWQLRSKHNTGDTLRCWLFVRRRGLGYKNYSPSLIIFAARSRASPSSDGAPALAFSSSLAQKHKNPNDMRLSLVFYVRRRGLEPPRPLQATPPQGAMSTISTPARDLSRGPSICLRDSPLLYLKFALFSTFFSSNT